MSEVASTTKLSGQPAVDIFLDELYELLKKTPGGRLKGSKRSVVERVVRESGRLTNCNIDHLTKQLSMAVKGANAKGRFNFSCGASSCEVSLA